MSEDNFRLDIDDIPMPTKEKLEEEASLNNDKEVNESWKRAQNALSQIGGRPAALLPTPTTSSSPHVPPFCFPYLQPYTTVPIPNSSTFSSNNTVPPPTFYQKPPNTFPSFSSRLSLPLQPISYTLTTNYRSIKFNFKCI